MDVYLVQPRGFCAGVRRALDVVQKALAEYGAPVYVRHEIVHNKHIIEDLKNQGVIFIEDLKEVIDKTRPIILSAHGAARQVYQEAQQKQFILIDATCPLVKAVHHHIKKLEQNGDDIIVIGKAGHPEILGTIGQLEYPEHAKLVGKKSDVENLKIDMNKSIGIVTQTTLSTDETQEIVEVLKQKFKNLKNAEHPNICFATTNRQNAIRELVKKTSNILVIGSKNSSNSRHLKEAALRCGAEQAWLIDDASEVVWQKLDNCHSIGITAGASAPEYLVKGVLSALRQRYGNINIYGVIIAEEKISFK